MGTAVIRRPAGSLGLREFFGTGGDGGGWGHVVAGPWLWIGGRVGVVKVEVFDGGETEVVVAGERESVVVGGMRHGWGWWQ